MPEWKNAQPGKWQEIVIHTMENNRKHITGSGNNGKCTTQKMTEWKMHTLENGSKITPWKKKENASLENERMENAPPWKLTE